MALKANPNIAHPLQVNWNSRNSNTVRSRTVSAALYNMSTQTSGIIAANIYRDDDAPRYKNGKYSPCPSITKSFPLSVFLLLPSFSSPSLLIPPNQHLTPSSPPAGNHTLLLLVFLNIILYIFTKIYYIKRNAYKAALWNAMSEEEKLHYISNTKDEGNKRLDFRFAH
jgi:hypothetical protein